MPGCGDGQGEHPLEGGASSSPGMWGGARCPWGLPGGRHARAHRALQHHKCVNSSVSRYANIFPTNNETVSVDIYQGVSGPGLCSVGIHTHLGDIALPSLAPGSGGCHNPAGRPGADGRGGGHFGVPM